MTLTIISAMTRLITSVLNRCLDQILPGNCVLCARLTQATSRLCKQCMEDLEGIECYCQVCGIPLPDCAGWGKICGACSGNGDSLAFRQCRSLFHYQAPVDQLITGFKFNARFAPGHSLAVLLAEAMQQHYSGLPRPETLVPVPLHPRRLQQRGYNQALELAKVVARVCQIPVSYNDVLRNRNSPPQTRLSATARKKNVRNVFSASAANKLKEVTFVAIIDDVMTTMSTASALAKLLVQQGVETVDVWTLARVSQEAIVENTEIPPALLNKLIYNDLQ